MREISRTSGLAGAIVGHPQARAAAEALGRASGDAGREHVATLMRYVAEREATSQDMRSTVQAILDTHGPSALEKIRRQVEVARTTGKA